MLKCFTSRRLGGERPATIADVPIITLEKCLQIPTVEAIIVCTENGNHEAAVSAGLAAGKHVLVEYPLCTDPAAGARLVKDAADRGLVVCVEHIELLTPAHLNLKQQLQAKLAASPGVAIASAEVTFSGSPLPSSWGHPAYNGIARLTRLWDLLGPLKPTAASCTWTATGTTAPDGSAVAGDTAAHSTDLQVELLAEASGARVTWRDTRCVGAARSTKLSIKLTDGTVLDGEATTGTGTIPGSNAGAGGSRGTAAKPLFQQDLEVFIGMVQRQRSGDADFRRGGYVSLQDELKWLQCAEEVKRLCEA